MSSLCSVGFLLHPRIPYRFMSSLWDFQKHPLCLKGALCSNKQNRQFNHCSELSKDALITILCCLLKVSTGSSSFSLIPSFSPSRQQRYAVVQTQLNHQLFHFPSFIPSISPASEQPDRVEVVRLSGGGGDQRHGGGHGPDGARRQSPEGSQLEGGKGDDGQSGRVPGLFDKLQQGKRPGGLPESYSALPAGERRN